MPIDDVPVNEFLNREEDDDAGDVDPGIDEDALDDDDMDTDTVADRS
jgi:hypothetical protein